MVRNRRKRPQMSATGAAIGSFVLFCLGFLASLLLLENVYFGPRRIALDAADWLTVPCAIVDIGVQVQSLRPVSGGSRTGSAGYVPFAVYEYVHDGQHYKGERFWFRNVLCNSREEAESALAAFEKDKPAVCFVDSKDPARSVLIRDFSPGGGILLLIPFALTMVTGLGMIGIPWAFWHSGRRQRRWRRSTDSTATSDQPKTSP